MLSIKEKIQSTFQNYCARGQLPRKSLGIVRTNEHVMQPSQDIVLCVWLFQDHVHPYHKEDEHGKVASFLFCARQLNIPFPWTYISSCIVRPTMQASICLHLCPFSPSQDQQQEQINGKMKRKKDIGRKKYIGRKRKYREKTNKCDK